MKDSGLSWHYTAASGSLSIKEKNRDSVPHEILSSSPKGRQREHKRERGPGHTNHGARKSPSPSGWGSIHSHREGNKGQAQPGSVSQGPGKTKAWNMQAQPGTRGNQGPARTGSETDPGGTEAWYTGSARGQSPTEEHLPPYQCPNSSPSVLPLFSLRTGVSSFHPQPHHNTFLLALPQIL